MTRRSYAPSTAKCLALAGHRSSGKTSLGDILLKTAKVTRSVGSVDEGTSLLDHETEERRRRMTLGPSVAWMEWEGQLLTLVDTPGGEELIAERELALAASDLTVVVISAPDGLEVGTRPSLGRPGPRVVVVNKMDRPHSLDGLIEQLGVAAGARVLPVQLPFFDDQGDFAGVICLRRQEVLRFDPDGSGSWSPEPVPARYQQPMAEALERMVEAVATTSDELLESYLEYLELPVEQVMEGLAAAMVTGEIVPLVYTAAATGMGAAPLLDLIADVAPRASAPVLARDDSGARVEVADEHLLAQVFATRLDADGKPYHLLRVFGGEASPGTWTNAHTGQRCRVRKLYQVRGPRRASAFYTRRGAVLATWDRLEGRPGDTWVTGPSLRLDAPDLPPPMMAYVLHPATRSDQDRLEEALALLRLLDPLLDIHQDQLTGELVLAGTTESHLQRAVKLLRDRLGLDVRAELPPVEYRETPARPVQGVEGLHVRESGEGVHEYGACVFDVAPRPPEQGIGFSSRVDDEELLPSRFVSPIGEGVQQATRHGPLAGYPVVGADVCLTGGEYDILFSTEDHFRLAGQAGFRAALERAGTRILEPWTEVEITIPADDVGPLLGALQNIRARIQGMEVRSGGVTCVRSSVPERELRAFAPRLMAISAGRGRFVRGASHYEDLPSDLTKEAIHASPFLEQR